MRASRSAVFRTWAVLGAIMLLAACGKNDGAGTAASVAAPTAALPPDIKSIYERSCKNCHAVTGTGAPQVGDAAAWAPRLVQGDAVLLDHTFNGFKSMPPMGACMDCTEPQYRALIEYMAGTPLPKK